MDTNQTRELNPQAGRLAGLDRSYVYAAIGFLLGVAAPVGWMLLRVLFFETEGGGLFAAMWADIFASSANFFNYLYMGGGTSVVLAVFGFFIGRASEQMHQRALRLDELNRSMTKQKEEFERRYRDLNARVRNFHGITARLQRSMEEEELFSLAGNALHEVLEFDRVNIFRVNTQENRLDIVHMLGSDESQTGAISLPLDERAGVLYKAVTDNRHYLVDDVRLMPAEFRMRPPCDGIEQLRSRSFVVCPVIVGDKVLALLCVDNKPSGRTMVEEDADTIKLLAGQLSGGIIRMGLVGAVEELTGELEQTFRELGEYRDRYKRLLKSLKESSSSTQKLVADLAGSADVVRDAVNATQSASGEISVSIEQVGHNISQLSEFMEKSISAMSEIAAAIRSVEDHSVQSHQMSQRAREEAENGAISVQETLKGLDGIRAGVEEAAAAVGRLSERGDEVSNITSLITEIAQKTNLLALNAAIIAAQAGEQGRSFAVVAEEIRRLSQQTAHSTEAIAGLIRDMQNGMNQVVDHIENTRKLVDNGVDKGRGADMALSEIVGTVKEAMGMAQKIRQATREVSSSAEFVTRSIEELGDMTEQVSTATREQVQGTRSIVRSIEDVRHMAEDMASATLQQRKNSETIEATVDSVSEMAFRIFRSMENRREQSKNVIQRLKQVKDSSLS